MTDTTADPTVRLRRLIAEVMKEIDPTRYDSLCKEIWLVLGEREPLEPRRRALQSRGVGGCEANQTPE
jgi:hypothetical protein